MFAAETKGSFPEEEEKILKFWEDESIFELSLQQREG